MISRLSPRAFLVVLLAEFLLSVAVISVVVRFLEPKILQATITDGGTTIPFRPPVAIPSGGQNVHVALTLRVSSHYQPASYEVYADDCVQKITMDGTPLEDSRLPFCDQTYRLLLPVSAGDHRFGFDLIDTGGAFAFDFGVSRTDPLELAWWLLVVASGTFFGLLARRSTRAPRDAFLFGASMVSVVFLRIVYVCTTLFFVRSHEWDKHLDYIRYVHDHLWIPAAAGGWEFHQSPLWYALAALWWRVADLFARPDYLVLLDFRTLSLLASIGGVACLFLMGRMFFRSLRMAALFGLLASLLPSVVFLSSQISNDSLSVTLAFLVILLSFLFWKSPTPRLWYVLLAVFSLALLTKLTALVLLPLLLLCAFFRYPRLRHAQKHLLYGGILCLLLLAPLVMTRLGEADQARTFALGNIGMDSSTHLVVTAKNTIAFHPLRILRDPYVHPNSADPAKADFPEYFFKSAFFGEYGFPDDFKTLCMLLLLFGMILLPFLVVGAWTEDSHPSSWTVPMSVLAVSILVGAIAYRGFFPFAPNQDFRFSIPLVIPVAYYILRGAQVSRPAWCRFAFSCAWALVALEVIFFLKLALTVVPIPT